MNGTGKRLWSALMLAGIVLIGGVILVEASVLPTPWNEDRATVEVIGDDGTKATVDVEVADTTQERYTGLSDHDSLADGEGMLFVHSSEANQTYVMRDMEFDIDIIFIGADGEITTIHHARAPGPGEDGNDLQYSGQAQWVLEVPRGYANQTEMAVGDSVEIEYD